MKDIKFDSLLWREARNRLLLDAIVDLSLPMLCITCLGRKAARCRHTSANFGLCTDPVIRPKI